MATLKICAYGSTSWITDIKSIRQVRSFSVEHPEDPFKDSRASDAHVVGYETNITNVVDFHESDKTGSVLVIERWKEEGLQEWVVPSRSCFLMSDTGKTIDRI